MKQWYGFGSSVKGPLHVKNGLPNQDAWLFKPYAWGSVGVVADGLGIKKHADYGAKMVCMAVLASSKVLAKHPQMKRIDFLRLVHAHWLALINPYNAKDCATTCLFSICLKDKILVGQLGDGMVVVHAKSKGKDILLMDNKENSFSNQTHAMNETFNFDAWRLQSLDSDDYVAVILTSDGISDDIIGNEFAFAAEMYHSYHTEKSVKLVQQDMARWLKDWSVPLHSDDKTILLMMQEDK